MMVMDIKMEVVQRSFNIVGNLISDLLSKPDWESRRSNIEKYYKDLQPIREVLPDAPMERAPREQREKEKTKSDEIINEICTPDLSPKELLECRSCVESVLRGSSTDIMQKYFKSP